MSYTCIYIHYVWSTKLRKPILVQPFRQKLFDHIRQNALVKDIYIDRINGFFDHIHCLIYLHPNQSIDKVAQLLKGESSYWFNQQKDMGNHKLYWQDQYFAVSVSLSMVLKTRAYIDNQEIHHQKMTFEEEYALFLKKYLKIKTLENSGEIFKINTMR